MEGMNVIITGATTGIGRATAALLAQKGANIFIVGSNPEHYQEAMTTLTEGSTKGNVSGTMADLSSKEGVENLFAEVDKTLEKIDVFINNAALAHQDVFDGEYEDWERVVKTNLLGYIACSRHVLDRMKANGNGHIVNVGSMSADVREKGSSVYVATKAGIQGFSESLRKEVNGLGIKVTLIEPGATSSDMQPAPADEQQTAVENMEMLQADDIAQAIYYTLVQPKRCDVVDIKIRPHLQLI